MQAELSRRRAICPGCGYDVQGLSKPRCPECGVELTRHALSRGWPAPVPAHARIALGLLMGSAILAWFGVGRAGDPFGGLCCINGCAIGLGTVWYMLWRAGSAEVSVTPSMAWKLGLMQWAVWGLVVLCAALTWGAPTRW